MTGCFWKNLMLMHRQKHSNSHTVSQCCIMMFPTFVFRSWGALSIPQKTLTWRQWREYLKGGAQYVSCLWGFYVIIPCDLVFLLTMPLLHPVSCWAASFVCLNTAGWNTQTGTGQPSRARWSISSGAVLSLLIHSAAHSSPVTLFLSHLLSWKAALWLWLVFTYTSLIIVISSFTSKITITSIVCTDSRLLCV